VPTFEIVTRGAKFGLLESLFQLPTILKDENKWQTEFKYVYFCIKKDTFGAKKHRKNIVFSQWLWLFYFTFAHLIQEILGFHQKILSLWLFFTSPIFQKRYLTQTSYFWKNKKENITIKNCLNIIATIPALVLGIHPYLEWLAWALPWVKVEFYNFLWQQLFKLYLGERLLDTSIPFLAKGSPICDFIILGDWRISPLMGLKFVKGLFDKRPALGAGGIGGGAKGSGCCLEGNLALVGDDKRLLGELLEIFRSRDLPIANSSSKACLKFLHYLAAHFLMHAGILQSLILVWCLVISTTSWTSKPWDLVS